MFSWNRTVYRVAGVGFPFAEVFLECGIERNHPDFHANIVRHTNTENRSGVSGKTYTQPSPQPPALQDVTSTVPDTLPFSW